jgi:hypothetical protein
MDKFQNPSNSEFIYLVNQLITCVDAGLVKKVIFIILMRNFFYVTVG